MAEAAVQDETVDEIDDLETDEIPEAGSESAGSESAGEGGSESAEPANKWDAMPSISELLEQADKAKETATTTGDDAGAADAGKTKEAGKQSDGERDAAKDEAGKGAAKGGAPSDAAESASTRFTVQDAEGNRYELELEPGTTIAFKADGKDVTVKSIDELVGYASKGVHADRQLSTMGQRVSTLERTNAEIKTQSEELLLKALFDRDARSALRKALAPFRDPKVREGHEALAREAERKAGEKTQSEQQIADARDEFWTGVGRQIKAALPEFQYLTEEDAADITTAFYANYESTFNAAVQAQVAAGKSEDEAVAAAQHAAFQALNDANLRKAMETVHGRYVKRLGDPPPKKKVGGKDPAPPASAADAAKAAEAHNRHTDSKLEQRATTPRLRSTGAAPAVTPAKTPEPATHKQREGEIKGLFRQMRGE